MDRRRFGLGLLATVGLQPRAQAADARVQHEARALMGTWVRITVVHAQPSRRRRGLDEAWQRMQSLADVMSRYSSDNALQALADRAGQPGWLVLPPALIPVLQSARAVSAFTHGAYDATVGAYRDWHFDGRTAPRIVDDATLQAQRPLVDWRWLQLDTARGRARLARAGMTLDLGGIAKLPILEAALQVLDAQGIGDAMIDGGGDVLCRGQLLGRDWRVGIRDPQDPRRLVGVVTLRDGLVASSGDYERSFELGGRRWHHVLDPGTGWPTRGVHGVALVARDVDSVNGLGAAIMVGGLAKARQWLGQRPQVDALVATSQGRWLSPGLRQRLQRA